MQGSPLSEQTQTELQDMSNIASVASAVDRSPQATAVSDQLVHRASASMADVHAHALARLATLKQQIEDLELTIGQARDDAQKHIQKFVGLVTDAEESARSIEEAIHRLGDHILGR